MEETKKKVKKKAPAKKKTPAKKKAPVKKAPRQESNAPSRDKLYDYSDVLTVLVIVLVAGLFIVWRVNALLNYQPAELVNDELSVEQVDATLDDKEALGEAMGDDQKEIDKTGKYTSFTISQDTTLEVIATNLKDEGLIEDTDEFVTRVQNAGKTGSLIPATYEIPEGATVNEIIDMFCTKQQ